jgi:hypothetical protein
MDSAIEKLSNEIDSLSNQLNSHTNNLSEYRSELQEKQNLLKELHKEHHELGMKMQKIIERCEKTQKQIKEQTEIVQNAERNLSSTQQRLTMKQNEYKQYKSQIDFEQREHNRFLQTIAGSLYPKFLSEFPQYKNTRHRWTIEEWGNYCLRCAQALEGEWNTFYQGYMTYPNHIAAQKAADEYNAEAGKKGKWSLGLCTDYIKEKISEKTSKNWLCAHNLKCLQFPPFPKFVFQPPCTPHMREARIGQSEKHYEACYNWVETNKQTVLHRIKSMEEQEEASKRAAEKRAEDEKRAAEEGVKNTETFKESILSNFLEKVGNSLKREEAEAILAKYYEPQVKSDKPDVRHLYLSQNVFKQDSLLAMKVCNRFAEQNEIRVEDAVSLFKEYATIKYTLPNTNKNNNNQTRTYNRDLNS